MDFNDAARDLYQRFNGVTNTSDVRNMLDDEVRSDGDEGGHEEPITAVDIKRALIGFTVERKLRGMRVLDGIRYNLVANNGRDFATIDILDGLLSLTRAALRLRDLRAA